MREDWRDNWPPAAVRPVFNKLKPMAFQPAPRPQRAGAPIRLLPGLVPLPNRLPDRGGLDPCLGRLGPLEVRLATTKKDIKRAQRLRYRVFYEELSAVPNAASLIARRDMDDFDPICDHVLVLDHSAPAKPFSVRKPKVVGTYRLLRQDVADRNFGFYTSSEFDVQPLLERHRGLRFLELGRSCVLKDYRDKRTVELLWHGIWTYVLHHRIDAMFGCASLDGIDPDKLALPLSFLHHHARAPESWSIAPLPERFVAMDRLPKDAVSARQAMHALPPLIKGYLRLGATFGEGAVVDRQFGTTDVVVILPVSAISQRYINHFGPSANRHAA